MLGAALALAGCDPQAIAELEEGVATGAEVVRGFGHTRSGWRM
ncbi:MAG: outer membrane protein assembly factor BamE, partial [Ottowia sp.]